MEIQIILSILALSLVVVVRVVMAYYFILDAKKKSPCLIRVTTSVRPDHFSRATRG